MKELNNKPLPSILRFQVKFHLKKDPASTESLKTTEIVCEGAPQEHQITHLPITSVWPGP